MSNRFRKRVHEISEMDLSAGERFSAFLQASLEDYWCSMVGVPDEPAIEPHSPDGPICQVKGSKGRPMYGYSRVAHRTWGLAPGEADVVRAILLASQLGGMKGVSGYHGSVADLLNECGYRTRSGKHWSASSVRNIANKHQKYQDYGGIIGLIGRNE
jgi:hypothetical protein